MTQPTIMQTPTPLQLVIADPTAIKKELVVPTTLLDDKALGTQADQYVEQLLSFNPQESPERDRRKSAVETMGLDLQRKAAKQSAMLKQPIHTLSQRGDDKGDVGTALIDLKMKVEELDPGKWDLEPGWLSRTLGRIPGIGSPLKRYFSQFESAQTVIGAITRSLEQGRDQLSRDNITLGDDQQAMREMTKKLDQTIKLGQLIDQKIQTHLEREIPASDPKHEFISEELIFPLRQRIIDLQQQLAVNQQGVLASEIVIRNNKELIRGVDRALNVTVTALQVGATVALALANQKVVLDQINSVSKTTSDLIAGTAARLKTQGAEIHKQAASTQIDMNALRSAFADINSALNDVSQFRMKALPQMANTILELDQLSSEAEKAIAKVESGNRSKSEIVLQVE